MRESSYSRGHRETGARATQKWTSRNIPRSSTAEKTVSQKDRQSPQRRFSSEQKWPEREAHSGQESPGSTLTAYLVSRSLNLLFAGSQPSTGSRLSCFSGWDNFFKGKANASCKKTFFPHGSLQAWPAATAVFLSQDSQEVLFFTGQ